jgi:hypothetical protein
MGVDQHVGLPRRQVQEFQDADPGSQSLFLESK